MMESDEQIAAQQVASLTHLARVVSDTLRFKAKLGIGEDAYTSTRYVKKVQELWDIAGVASSGAGVASSTTVATMFFAPQGLLASVGLAGTAATPIGWVLVAAFASGGAYYGVTRLMRDFGGGRVTVVPDFINTPIDLLGAGLFDLIAPLAVKLARIDGDYARLERAFIVEYFTQEWGYDPEYVEAALSIIEANADDAALNAMVSDLAEFKRSNPDCNYAAMAREIIGFLRELSVADFQLDEREDMAIERIEKILREGGRFSISRSLSSARKSVPTLKVPKVVWPRAES